MPRLPLLSAKELNSILVKQFNARPLGRWHGSHENFERYAKGQRYAFGIPAYREIPIGVLTRILKEAGITRDEFQAAYSG